MFVYYPTGSLIWLHGAQSEAQLWSTSQTGVWFQITFPTSVANSRRTSSGTQVSPRDGKEMTAQVRVEQVQQQVVALQENSCQMRPKSSTLTDALSRGHRQHWRFALFSAINTVNRYCLCSHSLMLAYASICNYIVVQKLFHTHHSHIVAISGIFHNFNEHVYCSLFLK